MGALRVSTQLVTVNNLQPKSHTLFHFTKNLDFLKDILVEGFWPRYCLEDSKWYGNSGMNYYIAYPMVCFCDIPLSRVDEHVSFYGNYGIGVTKEWAQINGLSPVIYLRENSSPHQALKKLFSKNNEKALYNNSNMDVNTLLANIKPTEGVMRIGSELVNKEFYQENEWRYSVTGNNSVSNIRPWISESEFLDESSLNAENAKTKEQASLKILPSDIKYLFVNTDSDIPLLVNFIQNEMDKYPSKDIKILLSRITSLETISRDL